MPAGRRSQEGVLLPPAGVELYVPLLCMLSRAIDRGDKSTRLGRRRTKPPPRHFTRSTHAYGCSSHVDQRYIFDNLCGPKERGRGLCRDKVQAQPHSARRRAVLVAVMRRLGLAGLLTRVSNVTRSALVLFDAARRKRGHVRGRGLGPSFRDSTPGGNLMFLVKTAATTRKKTQVGAPPTITSFQSKNR